VADVFVAPLTALDGLSIPEPVEVSAVALSRHVQPNPAAPQSETH